jgi:hypothetical protein
MKATLLIAFGLWAVVLGGCESDLPSNPSQPTVSFGNDKFREDGNERPSALTTDRKRNVW